VLGDGVHRFVVLQPEGDVPGLVICPTVEGVLLGHGEGCGHVVCLLVCIVDGAGVIRVPTEPVRRLSHCPRSRLHRPEPT